MRLFTEVPADVQGGVCDEQHEEDRPSCSPHIPERPPHEHLGPEVEREVGHEHIPHDRRTTLRLACVRLCRARTAAWTVPSSWRRVLRALAALEVSVVLSLSPLVTAFWAWLLLGDRLGTVPIIGMAIVVVGVVIVQLTRRRRATGFD